MASRCSAVPPLDCAVDRTGRLGLGRRPDSLARANSAYAATEAPASRRGGRRGRGIWLPCSITAGASNGTELEKLKKRLQFAM